MNSILHDIGSTAVLQPLPNLFVVLDGFGQDYLSSDLLTLSSAINKSWQH